MITQTPILYTFRRWPYAIRARMALTQLNLDIELREISLKNRPKQLLSAELFEWHPQKREKLGNRAVWQDLYLLDGAEILVVNLFL